MSGPRFYLSLFCVLWWLLRCPISKSSIKTVNIASSHPGTRLAHSPISEERLLRFNVLDAVIASWWYLVSRVLVGPAPELCKPVRLFTKGKSKFPCRNGIVDSSCRAIYSANGKAKEEMVLIIIKRVVRGRFIDIPIILLVFLCLIDIIRRWDVFFSLLLMMVTWN